MFPMGVVLSPSRVVGAEPRDPEGPNVGRKAWWEVSVRVDLCKRKRVERHM
jgi:hypothetical protein